jgi:hypothetical protein
MLVGMPDVDEIADELYGLPPEEFTATRTQYEKKAKAAGDREAAARIHGLAKPNVTAWLANQLAREHRDELAPLLEVGAALRDATNKLDGDQLRTLSRQQHQLVYALVQQARQLARAAGRSVSEEAARALEETLHAALAHEEAARLLLAGQLTEALHSSEFDSGLGFGSDAGTDAKVIPISRKAAGTSRVGPKPAEEQLRQAEQDFADAQQTLANATSARDDAQTRATDAEEAAVSAHERVEELRQQLEEASRAASDADRDRRELANALEQAERVVRGAERRNAEAQDRRDRLAKGD